MSWHSDYVFRHDHPQTLQDFEVRCLHDGDRPGPSTRSSWAGYHGFWVNGQRRREDNHPPRLTKRLSEGAWSVAHGYGIRCQLRFPNQHQHLVTTLPLDRCSWTYSQLAADQQCCTYTTEEGDKLEVCLSLSSEWIPGRNCTRDAQCSSHSCKGGRCCSQGGGTSKRCTACDHSGYCISCDTNHVLRVSENQCDPQCVQRRLAGHVLHVLHSTPRGIDSWGAVPPISI